MVLFALSVWIVASRHRRPWAMWLIPGIVAVWANLHGSFFLVAVPLLVAWLEDRRANPRGANGAVLVSLASLLAANLNPFGVRIWSYVVGISTNRQIVGLISEWQPTTIRTIEGFVFLASALVVAGVVVRQHRRLAWPPLVGIGVLFVLGLLAIRNTYWWPLGVPAFLAAALSRPSDPLEEDDAVSPAIKSEPRRLAPTLIAAMLLAVTIAYLPWWRPTFTSIATANFMSDGLISHAPHQVTDRLAQLLPPGQRVFVPQIWGSWFEFALPQDRVFVDSRIEIFPREVWVEYFQASDGLEGWQQVLDRRHVTVVVASRVLQPRLTHLIQAEPAWTRIYADAEAMVFERTANAGGPPTASSG
jgi:hypothetical protein